MKNLNDIESFFLIRAVPRRSLRARRGRLFRSSAFATASSVAKLPAVAALRRCSIAYRKSLK